MPPGTTESVQSVDYYCDSKLKCNLLAFMLEIDLHLMFLFSYPFLFYLIYLFIYLAFILFIFGWRWVFVAAHGFSLVAVSRLLIAVASPAAEHRL